ncbi:MAG: fatty acid cis/trans isomerase [Desulforhopalus sp.]
MKFRILSIVFVLLLLGGCTTKKPLPPVAFQPPAEPIDYVYEVRPVLVKRCVVCHSCYNSPCQLKLSSFEGLDRGATKKAIYNAGRLSTMEPTRLFIDADTTKEWRAKDFHSVTESSAGDGLNNSIMMQFLDHKKKEKLAVSESYYPEASDLTCAKNDEELGAYLSKHPNRGMPFGFPPLTEKEFNTVAGWLAQGAKGPSESQQANLETITAADQQEIDRWEAFLNNRDPKYLVTARYLYEHLFLAHIRFGTQENDFFELVRSRTGPGEPIDIIATDRPYDDPGGDPFYYRFRKIHSTLVHKTHMVFDLSEDTFSRINELFIVPDWLQPPHAISYESKLSANPFRAFEQIPPLSRYQFLLDNIHYIIMTFIRGPVCKGQVALNVVRDHFWLFFLDPDYDLSVQNPGFLQTYGKLLEMPLVEKNDRKILRSIFSNKYRQKASQYVKERRNYYSSHYRYREPGAEAIWRGEKSSDNPALTVFRHFDSASVHRGILGSLPLTMWVLDYPLIERIYYSLVAGFNVYGTAMHQLATRVYMDELRQEGETYFLDFMPEQKRVEMMKEWYGGMDVEGSRISYAPSDLAAGYSFKTSDPKREFAEYLVDHHLLSEVGFAFDKNYLRASEDYPPLPDKYEKLEDYIQGFKAVSRPGVSFFTNVADHNANVAYVRIMVNEKESDDIYLSVVINRWHDDVTTLFGEGQRLRPEKDNAVFIEGFVGSYPNYFLEVPYYDLPDLLEVLRDYDGSPAFEARLNRYGVNRAQSNFWEVYDRFQQRFNETDPVQAGLFDLNRYFHLALQQDADQTTK